MNKELIFNKNIYLDHSYECVKSIIFNIENYSTFVPWCTKSKILEWIDDKNCIAELSCEWNVFCSSFVSHVLFDDNKVTSKLHKPNIIIKDLLNIWEFQEVGADRTFVSIYNAVSINILYGYLINKVLNKANNKIVESFLNRIQAACTCKNNKLNEHSSNSKK